MNLDNLISPQPKKTILPTFSRQTPLFLGKKQETGTNNLYHHKAGFVAVLLSLRLRVHHIPKRCNNFYNMVATKYTLFLARPPKFVCMGHLATYSHTIDLFLILFRLNVEVFHKSH